MAETPQKDLLHLVREHEKPLPRQKEGGGEGGRRLPKLRVRKTASIFRRIIWRLERVGVLVPAAEIRVTCAYQPHLCKGSESTRLHGSPSPLWSLWIIRRRQYVTYSIISLVTNIIIYSDGPSPPQCKLFCYVKMS